MNNGNAAAPLILVVQDIEETRDGIEALLKTNGYRVDPVRNEDEAVRRGVRENPSALLVSLGGNAGEVVAAAVRIREGARLGEDIPIVVFSIGSVPEGAEVEVQRNVYVTSPDNFNQLRDLLGRVLHRPPRGNGI